MGDGNATGGDRFPDIAGFEVLEELGVGGMGTVYRAIQLEFDREVALKLVHRQLSSNPEFRERFRTEMQIAASLQHPNIVPVYAAGDSGRDLFMAMMLVPGENLATLVNRRGPMEPRAAVAIVAQIASALDEAHRRRLVHRDVKPQNVIIDERNSHAYLSDFGLARSLDATSGITATGHQMGTLDYMSPEQLDGRSADHRSDVYSLGCLLYAVVSGRRPFAGDSVGAVVRQKLLGPSDPTLDELGYPSALSQVVERAQADDPNQRYASAGEFAAAATGALGAPLAGSTEIVTAAGYTQPVDRPPPTLRQAATERVPADKPPRSSRRRLLLGGIAAALLAGVAVAAVLATSSGTDGGQGAASGASDGSSTTTTTTTSTVTDDTTTTTATASQKFESFSGNLYAAEVPKGWTPESVEEQNSGRYTSQWRDPDDPNTSVLIDSQPSDGGLSPIEAAESVRAQTSQTAGYKEVSFGPTTLNGADAAEWVFELPGDKRVDYFTVGCGAGFAILGSTSPERFDEMEPTFRHVAESVTPVCE